MPTIIEEIELQVTKTMEDKWYPIFEKRVGSWENTRELFLMFVADMENLEYTDNTKEPEDEVE